MKQRMMATIGIGVTVLLMALLAYTVYLFMGDPNSPTAMFSMASVSTGMMTFLVIFGIVFIVTYIPLMRKFFKLWKS